MTDSQYNRLIHKYVMLKKQVEQLQKTIGIYQTPNLPPEPDVSHIIKSVEVVYGLHQGETLTKKRNVPIPDARMMIMMLIDQTGAYSKTRISKMFKIAGAGMVQRSVRVINYRIQHEKGTREKYETVKRLLQGAEN